MKRNLVQKILILMISLLLALFSLFPFLQMLSISLKTPLEWGSPNLIPKVPSLEAYKNLLGVGKDDIDEANLSPSVKKILDNPKLTSSQRKAILQKDNKKSGFPFLKYMWNSFMLTMIASLSSLLISILGSYALSRLNFRFKSTIQRSILLVYLMGGVVIMVPLYQMANSVSLTKSGVGSFIALSLIYILQTLPLAMYMLGNYMRNLPYSLDEAAQLDGCNTLGIIFKIIIPLSRPILATVFIYCFIIAWNEYLYASVFLKTLPDLFTIPVGIRTLFVSQNAIWARIMSASVMTLAPILLFFGVISKHLQKGIIEGGVKE